MNEGKDFVQRVKQKHLDGKMKLTAGMCNALELIIKLESQLAKVEAELGKAKAENKLLREITEVKDPEQHFEQIMSSNSSLQSQLAKAKGEILLQDSFTGPHKDLSECPTFYDGCHCTVETLEENIKHAEELKTELDKAKEEVGIRLFRICRHCNKEFEVEPHIVSPVRTEQRLGEYGSNFPNCSLCGRRNDIWVRIEVVKPIPPLPGKESRTKERICPYCKIKGFSDIQHSCPATKKGNYGLNFQPLPESEGE